MRYPPIAEGTRFGKLVVVEVLERVKYSRRQCRCKCDCGKEKIIYAIYLNRNQTKSCGCITRELRARDLTGMVFGRLTVISRQLPKDYFEPILWNCICECGTKKAILASSLTRGRSQSCGCLHKEILVKGVKQRIEKYQDIRFTFLTKVRRNAKLRNLECSITIEDIWDIYISQNKKCYFTDLDIGFHDSKTHTGLLTSTASLDRIDSSRGYTKDNCCLVAKDINFMKQDLSVDKFLNYCKLIIKKYEQTLDTCKIIG